MILNQTYYNTLSDKVESIKTLTGFNNKVACLTTKLILEQYQLGNSIHFNIPNSKNILLEIIEHLFVELANDIYLNHYDLPILTKGTRVRDRRTHSDGKKHDYVIRSVNDFYILEHIKNKSQIEVGYDNLVKKFFPIEQGVRDKTIQNYTKFFSDLNTDMKLDFTPTNFDKKSVVIAKKPIWDDLYEKSKIPSIYLPNPREENSVTETRSIPSMSDCLIYFTPKYEVCYQQILLQKRKIKTIVLFNTELDKIEQILQDKIRFGFNIIILSNTLSPQRYSSISLWNWFKEEIRIINTL